MNFRLSYRMYTLLRYAIWVAFAFYVLSIVSIDYFADISYAIALGGVLIQMTIIRFLNNWYHKGKPFLLDYFRLATFLFILLNCFTMLDELTSDIKGFSVYRVKPVNVFPALLVIFVGLLGLQISEFLFTYLKRDREMVRKPVTYEIRNKTFFIAFSIFVAVVQLYLIISGQVGYGTFQENTTSDISFVYQLVFISCGFLLALHAAMIFLYGQMSKKDIFLFLIVFVIQLLYGFLSGMKEYIIVPIVIVLTPYILSGRRIPKNIIYIGVPAIMLIYPLNNNYRAVLNTYPKMDKTAAFLLAFDKTAELSLQDNVGQGGEDFSDRLSLFPFLVYSVEFESHWHAYKGMDRYVYVPVAWLLPRFVIPDKPKSDTGNILNDQIYGYGTNSLTVTTYGWSYYEGGFIFVFITFLLFGLFVSYYEFNIGTHTLLGLMLYIGLLVNLLKIESDIYFLVTGFLQKTLTYFVLYKIFVKTRPAYARS